MSISVNKSPLAGREGKLLQSRVIRDRLFKELDRNVALKVTSPYLSVLLSVCLSLVGLYLLPCLT
jgi:predicted membrane GTPase involved in stress response